MSFDRDHLTLDDIRQRAEMLTSPYLSLRQAANRLPAGRNGRPVHMATLVRWILTGSKAPSGDIVRLEAIRMGRRWLTTAEWLDDFARRLTPSFRKSQDQPVAKPRGRAPSLVSKDLDAAGIK